MSKRQGSPSVLRHSRTRGLLSLLFCASLFSPLAQANLIDDFTRADGATVGNGWIEKNPAAFRLSGGEAIKDAVSSGYRDNLVYRPASEDVLDVEASVEVRFNSSSPGYPQVLTRIQAGSAPSGGLLDGYILYVNNSASQAIVGRQRGSSFVVALGTLNLTTALNTVDRFRLRLRTEGTSPVAVSAYVERFDGSVWSVVGQSIVNDSSASRISTPGSVGFGGFVEAAYRYDNFVRVNLGGGATNPVPSISMLMPDSAMAGENGLMLTVAGSGFTTGSVVRWNGSDRQTTFVSAGELTANITPADQATAGTYNITVFNPAPGGGVSAPATFTVQPTATQNPVPAIASISPATATAGGPAFAMTVAGSGFASTAVVRWNGSDRATTFVSPTQLVAAITSEDTASSGTATVAVFNPAPGGGLSSGLPFVISQPQPPNPVPIAAALNPSSVAAESGPFTLTVDGSGFVAASVVRIGGSDRPTTFVGATRLQAAITGSDILTAGSRGITVSNPTPGGGESASLTLTVTSAGPSNPVPILSALSQQTIVAGAGSTLLTVTGGGFVASSSVRWNGASRPTTFVTSSELQVTLESGDVAAPAIGTITVANAAPGGGMSDPVSLLVLAEGSSGFADTFERANNASIGNGWTEKTPAAFWLEGGRVRGQYTNEPYHDTIVYRPEAEDRRDVEVGVEFIRGANNYAEGFPQVHARVQRDSLDQRFTLESYIFFVEDFLTRVAMIAVQPPIPDTFECYILAIPFPSDLEVGQRYRLRFQVTGTSPVNLTGIVERYANGAWTSFASGSIQHDLGMQRDPSLYCAPGAVPEPITDAGTTGFAKWRSQPDTYDNFHWADLGNGTTLPAPVSPVISTLSPAIAVAGDPALTLTVTGSGFRADSAVRFNGSMRTTSYVSPTQLQAAITAADLGNAGTFPVTVVNPGDPIQTSNEASFVVTPVTVPFTGFLDDFSRADSAALGNGWIEKNPAAFALAGGAAAKQSVGSGYRDNIVYRPASEDGLDGEASVEVRFTSSNVGYAQILTRVQSATVAGTGTLDGYILYINNSPTQAVLGRQRGSAFVTTLATINLSQPLNTSDTYRLRIAATGTNPVQVAGYVERWADSAWQVIGSGTVSDSSSSRIATAGSVGFGGFVENSYRFDNFRRD